MDRALAWTASVGAALVRLNPHLREDIELDQTDSKKLITLLADTELYLKEKAALVDRLCILLISA